MNVVRRRDMSFKIGDNVIVNEHGKYQITKPGSTGIIKGKGKKSTMTEGLMLVQFDHLVGRPLNSDCVIYWIAIRDLTLQSRGNKYFLIIAKINKMAETRKGKGYAY